ncbi:MAG: hypothetical protein IMY71_08105 [Bacteroidetes bacterium]|nr:hypothetical protein [Bacteroidota bacterium]
MKIRYIIIIGLVCLSLGGCYSGTEENMVTIVAPEARKADEGYKLACEYVTHSLQSKDISVSLVWLAPDLTLPEGNLILMGSREDLSDESWQPEKPEEYRISPVNLNGRKGLMVEGDERGTMFGMFKLAERIRIDSSFWQVEVNQTPAFPLRIFSEEGQLLDIPDRGYYSDNPPYVNEEIMRAEVDEMKNLIGHVVSLGYNSFSLLNLGVEEYIDYKCLDKQVYPQDDRHRVRSAVFCKYLSEVCDYAHSLHVNVYMQVYEIQFPPQLAKLYDIDIDSSDIERVINARYKELFERVPLDGMIVTATETHPRAGYASKNLWREKGYEGAGKMISMYHNACKAVGKKIIFRLWRIASDAEGINKITRHTPEDAIVAIKNTGGDYYLNWPTTTAITDGIAHEQPLVVLFDTFREFDGWSRLFIYMKRWGDVVRDCRDNGVIGINAWGAWAEGCIWPDYEPGYLTPEKDTVSWRGHWNTFRMFTRGFTPGQANVYLLSRLAWDPDEDVMKIAEDFAALHIGTANALATAGALLATEDAFAEEYIGTCSEITHPVYLKWTMVFAPRDEFMEAAYIKTPLNELLNSNTRALKKVSLMEEAFSRTEPSKAPDLKRYTEFKEGFNKTALYLQTFYLWRECWWRNRSDSDFTGEEKMANMAALKQTKTRLIDLFDQWEKYPEEAGFWRVTFRYGQPEISTAFPYWYPRGETTMETTAKEFGKTKY